MVLDIHCPEILQSPGKFAGLAPNVGWKEEGSWNFTITQMIAYAGRAYCKEHTIPVVKTVAPFLRDFPFHIHSCLPINAVQFTILSIIAMGYKPTVAYYRFECYRYCWPISITQQLIKRYSMKSYIFSKLRYWQGIWHFGKAQITTKIRGYHKFKRSSDNQCIGSWLIFGF